MVVIPPSKFRSAERHDEKRQLLETVAYLLAWRDFRFGSLAPQTARIDNNTDDLSSGAAPRVAPDVARPLICRSLAAESHYRGRLIAQLKGPLVILESHESPDQADESLSEALALRTPLWRGFQPGGLSEVQTVLLTLASLTEHHPHFAGDVLSKADVRWLFDQYLRVLSQCQLSLLPDRPDAINALIRFPEADSEGPSAKAYRSSMLPSPPWVDSYDDSEWSEVGLLTSGAEKLHIQVASGLKSIAFAADTTATMQHFAAYWAYFALRLASSSPRFAAEMAAAPSSSHETAGTQLFLRDIDVLTWWGVLSRNVPDAKDVSNCMTNRKDPAIEVLRTRMLAVDVTRLSNYNLLCHKAIAGDLEGAMAELEEMAAAARTRPGHDALNLMWARFDPDLRALSTHDRFQSRWNSTIEPAIVLEQEVLSELDALQRRLRAEILVPSDGADR